MEELQKQAKCISVAFGYILLYIFCVRTVSFVNCFDSGKQYMRIRDSAYKLKLLDAVAMAKPFTATTYYFLVEIFFSSNRLYTHLYVSSVFVPFALFHILSDIAGFMQLKV